MGYSAVFRVTSTGSYSQVPLHVSYANDAVLRPDGFLSVLASERDEVGGSPRTLYGMVGNGGTLVRQSGASPGTVLLPGAAVHPDGSTWAVASRWVAPDGGQVGGIVRFPTFGSVKVETFPFPAATDPLFTTAVGGLIRLGDVFYGHCRSPDNGGCLYRVTSSGRIERALTFERYAVPPRRVAGHGPVVLSDGMVVVPTQEETTSTSLRLETFRPGDGSWQNSLASSPEGLPRIAEQNNRFGIVNGPGPVLWITENVTTDGLLALRVLRHSTDTGSLEVVGSVRQTELEQNHWGKHPTLASDGRWYATGRSGDSPVHAGLLYRFGAQANSLEVVRRFPLDSSMGRAPMGRLLEAQPGWLYGTVGVAPGGAMVGAVYRIRLDGTGFDTLSVLPGQVVGGLMQGSDGSLYVLVQSSGDAAGMVLMRMRLPNHATAELARWPESVFGGLVFDGPPIEGPDRRLYITGYRSASPWSGVIVSVGRSGGYPRVDLDLAGTPLGARFVPPLAVGGSGWIYAVTYGGGTAGYGGVFRFRPRLEIRATTNRLQVASYPGARVRIEGSSDPGGEWIVERDPVPLDAAGNGEVWIESGADHRFFRASFGDEDELEIEEDAAKKASARVDFKPVDSGGFQNGGGDSGVNGGLTVGVGSDGIGSPTGRSVGEQGIRK